MTSYEEKIQKLSLITGHPFSIDDCFNLRNSECLKIERLKEKEMKKELIEYLTEQEEVCLDELKNSEGIDETYLEEIKSKVDAIKQKYKILATYVDVVRGDEFPINKMNVETKLHTNEYWIKIKPLIDFYRSLQCELNGLKQLHNNYLGVLQKTNTLIAPPH